jgi:hypothetical protein
MINILSKIQRELRVPKGQMNEFGGYKYRSCEDILEAVKPLLPEGVVLLLSDDIVQTGDRYYVKATATLLDGKGKLEVSAFAREALDKKKSDDAQITGATSCYARKYALNGLFCIDDTKDADATNDHDKASKGNFNPIDKSTKAIHKEWKDAMELINNAEDPESVKAVGRYQWKRLKELGATQGELDLIQQQTENRSTELSNRELDRSAMERM